MSSISETEVIDLITECYEQTCVLAPGDLRTVGHEDELQLVYSGSGLMGDAQDILIAFVDMPGWTDKYDEDVRGPTEVLVGARNGSFGELGTDAGRGVLEWASGVKDNLLHIQADRREMLKSLIRLAWKSGQLIIGTGRTPVTRSKWPTLWTRKDRYKYLIKFYAGLLWPSAETSAQQLHVGVYSPQEMIWINNTMLSLAGVLTALAANSAVYRGSVHHEKQASRQIVWDDFSQGKSGVPDRPYESVRDWATRLAHTTYVLVPNIIDGEQHGYREVEPPGQTFCEFLMANPDQIEHLRTHLVYMENTIWEDARPRFDLGTVEIRPCGQQLQSVGIALDALMLGVIENRSDTEALLSGFAWKDWRKSRYDAVQHGLKSFGGELTLVRNVPLLEVLRDLVEIAKTGLASRDLGEETLLDPIEERLAIGHSPAIDAAHAFGEGMKSFLDYHAYTEANNT